MSYIIKLKLDSGEIVTPGAGNGNPWPGDVYDTLEEAKAARDTIGFPNTRRVARIYKLEEVPEKYEVRVHERWTRTYLVEAHSEEEARLIAEERVEDDLFEYVEELDVEILTERS